MVAAMLCFACFLFGACGKEAVAIEGVEGYQAEVVFRYLSYFDIDEIISVEKTEQFELEGEFEKFFKQTCSGFDIIDQKGKFAMLLNDYGDVMLIVDSDSGKVVFNMMQNALEGSALLHY